jgi:hypothetical protein
MKKPRITEVEEWLGLNYGSLSLDVFDDVHQQDNRKDTSIRTFFVPGQQVAWKQSQLRSCSVRTVAGECQKERRLVRNSLMVVHELQRNLSGSTIVHLIYEQ